MDENEIVLKAAKLAFKNKKDLKCKFAGCYYCGKVFETNTIKEWTDKSQTALCPHCSVDAVVPNVVDVSILKKAHQYWFQRA